MNRTKLLAFAIWVASTSATGALAQEKPDLQTSQGKALTYEMLVSQYNFPVKKHTGNPEKDQQVYAAEKQKWVQANQELYRRYNQQGLPDGPVTRRKTQAVLSPSKEAVLSQSR